jgi:hypothetical protein
MLLNLLGQIQTVPNLLLSRPDLLEVHVLVPNASVSPVLQKLLDRGIIQETYQKDRTKEFRYVLDINGHSSAWRLASNIGWGAVTLKNKTPWLE